MRNKKVLLVLAVFVILISAVYLLNSKKNPPTPLSSEQKSVATELGEYFQKMPSANLSSQDISQILKSEEFNNFISQNVKSSDSGDRFIGRSQVAQSFVLSCELGLKMLISWGELIIDNYNDMIGVYGVDEANSRISAAVEQFMGKYRDWYLKCMAFPV